MPWQRVINSRGMVSHRYLPRVHLIRIGSGRANQCSGPGSAAGQAEAHRQEGVEVDTDAMGEFHVDFARYGWFPDPEVFDEEQEQ